MAQSIAEYPTPRTILFRIRDPADREAWDQFVDTYGPRILQWCRQQGLQESDCEDVAQDVLFRLVTAMRKFEYDPRRGRFRGWLKTVTRNSISNFALARQRRVTGSGDTSVRELLNAVTDPTTVDSLTELIEQQAQQELLGEAELRVQLKVKPQNWEAWRLSSHEGLKATEIAQSLNITVSDVYVARSRIAAMLRREFQLLTGDEP